MIAVVLTAVLEVLDMTIVNVSIPHMLGAFAATPDQITWVLTSYIVAAAVVMPLTGYLSNWLGRRRLLLTAIIGFVVSSALCGMSWSLESMVVFRLAQGVFGAPLVPLSQAILLDAFPRESARPGVGDLRHGHHGGAGDRPRARRLSHRDLFLAHGVLHQRAARHFCPVDGHRLSAETSDQGHEDRLGGHGTSGARRRRAAIRPRPGPDRATGSTPASSSPAPSSPSSPRAAFFLRGWNKSDNIIDLSLLRDRNFVAGTLAITAYGISLFGWMAIMPLFSQRLLGYPPDVAGTLFIPRGIVSAITLAITGSILIRMFDARWLVTAGLVMTALGTLPMAYFNLYVDFWGIATPGMLAGIGSGLFFVPLTAVAFASIPKAQYDEASGVYALMRGIGGSAGIAVVSWLFVRQTQIHFNELTAHVTPLQPGPHSLSRPIRAHAPTRRNRRPLIAHEIGRQAQMLAFNDIFWFIAMVTLAIIPLIFLMKKPEKVSLVPPIAAEPEAERAGKSGSAPGGSPRGTMQGLSNYQQALAPEVQT